MADVVPAHVPAVGRMGLTDVDHQELDPLVVLLVELSKAHGPFHERGSGEAPEDQRDGSLSTELRQSNGRRALRVLQLETRREISGLGRQRIVLSVPRAAFTNSADCPAD